MNQQVLAQKKETVSELNDILKNSSIPPSLFLILGSALTKSTSFVTI